MNKSMSKITKTSKLVFDGVKMTSRDIAELTGKRHDNVVRDIKKEIIELKEIGHLIFEESYYLNLQNKQQPQFTFGKKGAMQLALKYDAVTRFKVIERIEELESKKVALPTNYVEALSHLLESEKQKELILEDNKQLQIENEQLNEYAEEVKPILSYMDSILTSTKTMTVTQIGDDYGLTAQKLNKILHEAQIQYKVNSKWILYKAHKGKKYTTTEHHRIKHKSGDIELRPYTSWTQRGRIVIHNILTGLGHMSINDRALEE